MSNYTISNIKMNNNFSLQQIQKTSNLDANLISRQYKVNLMVDFMRVKYESPNLKQSQIANQLGYSISTLQRYRNDINMPSPYKINPNNTNKRTKKVSHTNFNDNSHPEHDLKRPQLTSNDLKTTSNEPVKIKKNRLKSGSAHENIEINEHYLDEVFHKNDL